ncbi:MAG: HXXEE domain-containing protein [Solirubrobacteraceae bacterium]
MRSRQRVLGIAPVLFGFLQAAGHGTIFPKLAGDRYSPGFLASLLLHVPIGINYLCALDAEKPIKRSDLAKAMAYNFAFAISSIAGPNILLKNKNSPYRFTAKQMGPHLPSGSAT